MTHNQPPYIRDCHIQIATTAFIIEPIHLQLYTIQNRKATISQSSFKGKFYSESSLLFWSARDLHLMEFALLTKGRTLARSRSPARSPV
jgi:hypothetical protein